MLQSTIAFKPQQHPTKYAALERPGSLTATVETLLTHAAKLLNIFQHVITATRPLFVPRGQKPDLFSSARDLLAIQATGYFGNDYFYLNLYNVVLAAYGGYRQHVTRHAGTAMFALLRNVLRSLHCVLELKSPVATREPIRLIEELLGYLGAVLPYATHEAIGCVQHLLRFMFARNYACRHDEYAWFVRNAGKGPAMLPAAERFAMLRQFQCNGACEADTPTMLGLNIKLFEPMVIQCMKLFPKCASDGQADILEMIGEMLTHRVSYKLLDANGLFGEFVFKLLELIEAGHVRHSERVVPSVFRFLFHLVGQRDQQLVSVPKIINMCDNLLATKGIFKSAALALNELAFEFFFRTPMAGEVGVWTTATAGVGDGSEEAAAAAQMLENDASTQREVVVSMLVKYMETEKVSATHTVATEPGHSNSITRGHVHTQIHRSICAIMLLYGASISDTEVLVNLQQVLQRKPAQSYAFLASAARLLRLVQPYSMRAQLPALLNMWCDSVLLPDQTVSGWEFLSEYGKCLVHLNGIKQYIGCNVRVLNFIFFDLAIKLKLVHCFC